MRSDSSGDDRRSTSRESFLSRLLVTTLAVHLALFLLSAMLALGFVKHASKLDGLLIAIVLATAMANHGLHAVLGSIWRKSVRRERLDTLGFVIGSSVIAAIAACGLTFFI